MVGRLYAPFMKKRIILKVRTQKKTFLFYFFTFSQKYSEKICNFVTWIFYLKYNVNLER